MDEDQKQQDLVKELMYFVAFKLKLIPVQPPIRVLSVRADLIENFRRVVWVERYLSAADASKFIRKHHDRMNQSTEMYVNYLLFLCNVTKKCFVDAYEVVIRAMSLIVHITIISKADKFADALGWAAAIFAHYYEREIRADFYKLGGWEKFNNYLLKRDTLKLCVTLDLLESAGETRVEIAKLLKLQTTRLKTFLSKDFHEADIEGHGPTLYLRDVVINNDLNIKDEISSSLQKYQNMDEDTMKMALKASESDMSLDDSSDTEVSSDVSEPTLPENFAYQSSEFVYLKVKQHVKEMHAKCQRIEQLLDFIFDETQ